MEEGFGDGGVEYEEYEEEQYGYEGGQALEVSKGENVPYFILFMQVLVFVGKHYAGAENI